MSASNVLGSMLSFLESARRRLHSDHARWLLFVVFYAVFANVPFWTASHWLGLLPLGWFCVEYAGIGLLALFVPRILAAALLLAAIAADLTSAVSKTYYLSPADCLKGVGELQELPGDRLVAVATVAVLVLLTIAIAIALPVERIRGTCRSYAAMSLVAFAAIAVSADSFSVVRETGHWPNPFRTTRPGDSEKFSDFRNLWINRYPILRLVHDEKLFGTDRSSMSASLENTLPIPSAAATGIRLAGLDSVRSSQQMPNLVLVLLESWGIDSDSSVRDSLVRPYTQPELSSRYEVLQGTVPFFGSTVGGEARELCGSQIGLEITNVSMQGLRGCLPTKLASLGYHSIALHGMSGRMFSRQTWYSSIGFQERWFREQFRQDGLPDCTGAFVGTCDAAVAEWIGHRLATRETGPDFAYWVTLNSHLPLPVPSGLAGAASCAATPLLSTQRALCSWFQLVANVHGSVAQLAMAQLGRPTVFIIVGDHAPPFANPALRSQFSSVDVPYVLLLPRQENRAANDR